MKKTIYIAIIVALLIIIIALGLFIFTKTGKNTPQSDSVNSLLLDLNKEMSKPGASLETVNDFLANKYGPCWGIPEGQCRE